MTFTRIQSADAVREDLVARLSSRLAANTPVLFLVSGGSTAKTAVEVCRRITASFSDRERILKLIFTVTLADERYGPEGHPDSNWRLLIEEGLEPGAFATMPLVARDSLDRETLKRDTASFNAFLSDAVMRHAHGDLYIAGLFGVGEDGHTAGILPGSPPLSIPDDGAHYAASYESAIFTRLTISPALFRHIDFAAAYASGPAKRKALLGLAGNAAREEAPAVLLRLARESIVYTDQEIQSAEVTQ